MNIKWPEPAKYLVAVSGGVDSVALLDLLAGRPGYQLAAAHFNHRLRPDSDEDEALARAMAVRYGVRFFAGYWESPRPGEAAARQARYAFLRQAAGEFGAKAVVTGHHYDDLMETAALNLLRGTGRTGLTPFRGLIRRPLAGVKKDDIYEYARKAGLAWREDPTNQDTAYFRNRVRRELLPQLSQQAGFSREFADILNQAAETNRRIDAGIRQLLPRSREGRITFERRFLRAMPIAVLAEVLRSAVLEIQPSAQIDSRSLEKAAVSTKTGQTARVGLSGGLSAIVGNDTVIIAFLP